MSCSDTFYPGNLETKTLLAQCGKFKALLRDSFTAVNHLIDCIEENFPGQKLEKIDFQKSKSLGINCSIIIERANQIERFLARKSFDVEERMDTNLFSKLQDLNIKFEEQIEICRRTQYSLVGIALTLACFVTVTMIKKGYVTDNDVSKFGIMKTCFLVSAILAVLCVGIDMVLSVFYGAFERKELEQALEEYTTAIYDFEPAARKWNRNMRKLTETIEVHNKKTNSTL